MFNVSWTTSLTNSAINENQLIFDKVTQGVQKCITFNVTHGVAHITFHILFVIFDAMLAKTLLPMAYLYPFPLDIRVYCIPLKLQCIKTCLKTITPELDYC